jgi:hypothetical protein
VSGFLIAGAGVVRAQGGGQSGSSLPSHADLRAALVSARSASTGGFNLDMWGTVVNRDGIVWCAVAFTGNDRGDQWPGSRVISAQKANTANAFSLALYDASGTLVGAVGVSGIRRARTTTSRGAPGTRSISASCREG